MKENYCTFFFEGSWTECCRKHDIAYETQAPKGQSDIELFNCVRESDPTAVTWVVAALMFAGVSLFGARFYRKKD